MNWYKVSFDFGERNFIREKIKKFEELIDILEKMKKMAVQSGRITKITSFDIVNSKFMSSYPIIRDILAEANRIVLDSPWKFSFLCDNAIIKINEKIWELKKDREKLINPDKVQKGWQ